MLLNWIVLIIGFILLIKGADALVEGSESLASIMKIPAIIVGLVIVSFGTSAPEAAVSITAGLAGANDIALSNVVGSNIFNILLVLGISAVIYPLLVPRSIIRIEFPLLIGVSTLTVLLSYVGMSLSRIDGFILFGLIVIYLIWLVQDSLSKRKSIEVEKPKFNLAISIVFVVIGLACIIFGGDLVVNSSKAIALNLGLSERFIGLTIVSIGTSLPELVTSVVAARKGSVEIAVGNVIGSSIFNLLFILGISSLITPIVVDRVLFVDLVFMIFSVIVTYYFSKKDEQLDKKEGIIFILLFVAYLTFIIARN